MDELFVEELRVDDWESQVIQDSHLLKVLIRHLSKSDIERLDLSFWLCNLRVVEDSFIWGWKFTDKRNLVSSC